MIDRFCSEALANMDREQMARVIHDLVVLHTIYDVTLQVVVACSGGLDSLEPIARSQVEAARAACLEVTGEPSMVGFSRFNHTEN